MGRSKNGKWYLLLSVAVAAGLFHPNCRHTLTTYREGNRPSPEMDGEEIRRRYALEQKQRAKERTVRKWKRMELGTDDPVMKDAYKKKIRAAQKDLRDFIEENKDILRRDYARESSYGVSYVSPKDAINRNDTEQYQRYVQRLGDTAPGTFEEFRKLKYVGGEAWDDLQTEYRFTGIVDRMLERYPNLRVYDEPGEIPDAYNFAVRGLPGEEQEALFHYSHYEEGVRMNLSLGHVEGIELSAQETENLLNVESALSRSALPYDTLLWRGTETKLLNGFEKLPEQLNDWKGREIYYDGFASTSILRNASYISKKNKNVQLVLAKKADKIGAAYIDEISYNRANGLQAEYEVLLQKRAKYRIIEAQIFKGKYIIVAEVL